MALKERAMPKTQIDTADDLECVTITEFKARAREVIASVGPRKAVAILRHNAADAVLISLSDYEEFVRLKRERLNFLTGRYEAMVARMQTPESAAGVDELFNASSEELGHAALGAALGTATRR
jgi:prevent-host-death family protein